MKELYNSVQQLVPHRPPMLLINSVLEADDEGLIAKVNPAESSLFIDSEGRVPAYVGIEYMAQAISAWAGLIAHKAGKPIQLGFLLGTRRYQARVPFFDLNTPLQIHVREILRDEMNLALFDCQIFAGEMLLASAQIKAIQPDNIDDVFGLSAE